MLGLLVPRWIKLYGLDDVCFCQWGSSGESGLGQEQFV